MSDGLKRLQVHRRTGEEPFTSQGAPSGIRLLEFWQWAHSDLASNIARGVLAEFLVARALDLDAAIRDPWQPYDLNTRRGLTLEIKSAAYLQSWWQRTESAILFGIQPTHAWNAEDNTLAAERQRQAAAYVFCLLHHRDKSTLDPMNLDQWEFFLVPTTRLTALGPTRKTLPLKGLLALDPVRACYAELAMAVEGLEHRLLDPPA